MKKECPECKITINENLQCCTNCGFPFPSISKLTFNKESHRTKNCPSCNFETNYDDKFCTTCGHDFIKHEQTLKEKTKNNKKECPECKLLVNSNLHTCTNCGFPFPLNSTSQNKHSISETPNIDQTQSIKDSIIETNNDKNLHQESHIKQTNKQNDPHKNSNHIYYIVFGSLLLLIILCIVWYKFVFSKTSAELALKEIYKSDSIAAIEQRISDSISNIGSENNQNSVQGELKSENTNRIKLEEVATKICKYYQDIQLDRIDANDYFSENVYQYMSRKNITPKDINDIALNGKKEFTENEFTFNTDYIDYIKTENNIDYYGFWMRYKCFRISKQKMQECDVYVEIGVNPINEFVSLKESQIENLNFYDKESPILNTNEKNIESNEEIFSIVEEMPEFPGGAMEMMKFIQKNFQYPQMAKEAGISGKCFLKFIVKDNGQITDIVILKGVAGCSECDLEAVRLIKSMPRWKPAKQDGRNVSVFFTLPINFNLK